MRNFQAKLGNADPAVICGVVCVHDVLLVCLLNSCIIFKVDEQKPAWFYFFRQMPESFRICVIIVSNTVTLTEKQNTDIIL